MKRSKDFKRIALDALKGRWIMAVIAGLIASILGAAQSSSVNINLNSGETETTTGNLRMFMEQHPIFAGAIVYVFIVALILGVLFFVLSSIVSVGYSKYNLELVDGQNEPGIGVLFNYISYWKTTAMANFLRFLYTFLWMLLLVIPGIIAAFNYAMVPYVLAENPELTASEALARSKALMCGNRWRLFCLGFSFIGWGLLAGLTLGIGNLFLVPYQQAATAAFYRDISTTVNAEF